MKRMKRLFLRACVALVLGMGVLVSICSKPAIAHAETPVVRVGSKRFPESLILGEIAVAVLRRAGVPAEHRAGLGGTAIVWTALQSNAIDLYPEYTGSLVHNLLGDDRRLSPEELTAALAKEDLAVGPHLGFANTYALAVKKTGKTADLLSISQLATRSDLVLGFSHEFIGRDDGWVGLSSRYGLGSLAPKGLDHGLAYDALGAGSIDLTDAYSTDARIARMDLRVLDDDRAFFPNYDAMLVMRRSLSVEATRALATLAGRLTPETMRALNAAVELDGRTPAEAAERFTDDLSPRGGVLRPRPSFLSDLLGVLRAEGPRHLMLVFVSLLAAVLIGVPLGILAHARRGLGRLVLGLAGILQTIPSLAMLAFLIPVFGIGVTPALCALFVYALLPIVRNTVVGLDEVPTAQREAAMVMDLSVSTRLLQIDLPLASRTILAGVKTSAIINVGTATIAAFIGAGGFGVPISTGLGLSDTRMILLGAIPAACLAIALEGLFFVMDRWSVPEGLRLEGRQRDERQSP